MGWGWSLVQNNNLAHKGTATCHYRPLRSSALSSRVVASALDSAAASAGRRSSRSPWEQAFGREARRLRAPGRRHRRGVGRRSCAAFALVLPPQCLAYSVLQPPCARNPEITETSEIPWNSRQCGSLKQSWTLAAAWGGAAPAPSDPTLPRAVAL